MHVHLITNGGTISALPDETGALRPALRGSDLLRYARQLGPLPEVIVHEGRSIPSEHATPGFWCELADQIEALMADPEATGIVLTHGTDTMEETAFYLHNTLRWDRPIVLTGAQRPLSDPDSDGPRNLRNALHVACSQLLHGAGVLVVFDGQVHAASAVTKVHTTAVRAFDSGEVGSVATLNQDCLELNWRPLPGPHCPCRVARHRVDIIPVYPGADASLLEASLASGAAGLVVSALGCGNVNPPIHEALVRAMDRGVPVVISTRVPRGPVLPLYGAVGGGAALARAGAIFANNLPPHKARVLLLLALANGVQGLELRALFEQYTARERFADLVVGAAAEHKQAR